MPICKTGRMRSRTSFIAATRLVVVGSKSSSNSNRLREMADRGGIPGYLVDGPENLHREWSTVPRPCGCNGRCNRPPRSWCKV